MTNLPSPLAEASPDSLTLLFEHDPLTLSDAQIMTGITELRRRRSEFASAEAAKALAPRKTRTASTTPSSASDSVTLDKPTADIALDDLL